MICFCHVPAGIRRCGGSRNSTSPFLICCHAWVHTLLCTCTPPRTPAPRQALSMNIIFYLVVFGVLHGVKGVWYQLVSMRTPTNWNSMRRKVAIVRHFRCLRALHSDRIRAQYFKISISRCVCFSYGFSGWLVLPAIFLCTSVFYPDNTALDRASAHLTLRFRFIVWQLFVLCSAAKTKLIEDCALTDQLHHFLR